LLLSLFLLLSWLRFCWVGWCFRAIPKAVDEELVSFLCRCGWTAFRSCLVLLCMVCSLQLSIRIFYNLKHSPAVSCLESDCIFVPGYFLGKVFLFLFFVFFCSFLYVRRVYLRIVADRIRSSYRLAPPFLPLYFFVCLVPCGSWMCCVYRAGWVSR